VPSEYLLDHQGAERAECERLELVEHYHDPSTVSVLEQLGVADGWRCLDVGAGGGSVARWLAARVLPGGEVVATDLDTRLLEPLAQVGVCVKRGDITAGPPAVGAFDLVHARLLLIHLPRRVRATGQLAAAARPGGWVVVGDIDFTTFAPLAPWPGWKGVWESFLLAVEHAGWDVACGRRLTMLLASVGLEQVQTEATGGSARGGELPCELLARTLERHRDRLLAMDVPPGDLDTTMGELRNPAHEFITPTVWAAWGRKQQHNKAHP
jgi:SAM-dependent methyltransferase